MTPNRWPTPRRVIHGAGKSCMIFFILEVLRCPDNRSIDIVTLDLPSRLTTSSSADNKGHEIQTASFVVGSHHFSNFN